MLLLKLNLLLISSTLLVSACFCPTPAAPTCGCSSSSYGSPSNSYATNLQPQTIFYTQPIPVSGPIAPAPTSYSQQAPIYVKSAYQPVANQIPISSYSYQPAPQPLPQPGYVLVPTNPAIPQNSLPAYQPAIYNTYPAPYVPHSPSIIKQISVVPSVRENIVTSPSETIIPSPAHSISRTTVVHPPAGPYPKPTVTKTTEDGFEIIRPIEPFGPESTSETVPTLSPNIIVHSTTISSVPKTVPLTVDEVEELEIVESTTAKPHDSTTRIVPIPRKEGDGRSDDYEYFYIYYDDDKNQTTKSAGINGKTLTKNNDFNDFDDNAQEASVTDGKIELTEGDDYNVEAVNAIRRNIKTTYQVKTAKALGTEKNSINEITEKPVITPSTHQYSEDEYDEYESQESQEQSQNLTIDESSTTTLVPVEDDQGIYKRANTLAISKIAAFRPESKSVVHASATTTSSSSSKPLRANRTKLNDGEIVRHHPKI